MEMTKADQALLHPKIIEMTYSLHQTIFDCFIYSFLTADLNNTGIYSQAVNDAKTCIQTFSVDYKAQAIIIVSRIDFSSFSYLSGCWSFIIRKPDVQHADENDNWLRILYSLTVCEHARSFERIDHRTDSDGNASTDFKTFATSLFYESTRERRARDLRIAMID